MRLRKGIGERYWKKGSEAPEEKVSESNSKK